MGYSCTARARFTEEIIQERFRHANSGNVFSTDGGKTTFFTERGREQDDGAITGNVYANLPNGMARKVGSYRIDSDGKIIRFSHISKKYWVEMEVLSEKRYVDTYNPVVRQILDSDTPRP